MTRKRFVLSKCLGGIKRNSTGHIIGAEATTILYGVRFNPKLNPKEGRLVSSKHFLNLNINCFVYYLYSSHHHNAMSCLALVATQAGKALKIRLIKLKVTANITSPTRCDASFTLFLYCFLPGFHGQSISVRYPRRISQTVYPKTIDQGEISRPGN